LFANSLLTRHLTKKCADLRGHSGDVSLTKPLLIALFAQFALPVLAADRADFYGTWGTPSQCARAPLKSGGTVLAEPFQIGPEWLKHGRIWCRLTWFPIQPRSDGAFTGARAQCGEDTVQGYTLRFNLVAGTMTLRWDVFRASGPLDRCPLE